MVELRGGMTAASCGYPGAYPGTATDRSSAKQRLHRSLLTVLDTMFSALLAAPAVVGYWRGTWGLSDAYIYPGRPVYSSVTSIIVGFAGLFAFNALQHSLDELLHPDKHRLLYYAGSRLYTAVFGFCCVSAWRGAWQALDVYTEHTPTTVFATIAVSLLALLMMRAIRNISAPPLSLGLDTFPGYFDVQTMFRVDVSSASTRDWWCYLLDCAFSVVVVGTPVVFVWRGVWILFDLYLYPEDRKSSAIGSLVIGYAIVVLSFSLQPLMQYICGRLQGCARLIAADAFLLLSFLGTVNVWRGIWGALDHWFIPENPVLSCWITHVGCFVFLVLLHCSNSILVRGVYIDAEEEDGKCVAFPCQYIRLFFKIEREKKEARRRNLLMASKDLKPRGDGNAKDAENGALLPNSTAQTILPANPESLV